MPLQFNQFVRALMAGGGGAALTQLPAQAQIVEAWHSDAITPQADASQLAAWTGSVAGVTLAQATAGTRPLYRTTGVNGKPYVSMSGSQMMSVTADATLNAAMSGGKFTLMAFFRNAVGKAFGIVAAANTGNSNLYVASSSYTVAGYGNTYGAGNAAAGRMNWDGSAGSSTVQSVAVAFGGGVTTLFNSTVFNGAHVTMGGSNWGAPNGTLYLGSSTAANSYQGELYSLVLWNRALTPAETMQAQQWASDKFGQVSPVQQYGKLYIAAGDSQTLGYQSTSPFLDNYAYKIAVAQSIPMGCWMNLGQTSQQTGNLDTWAATAIDGIPALVGPSVNTVLSYLEYYNIRLLGNPAGLNLTYATNRKTAGFNKFVLATCSDSVDHPAGRATYLSSLASGYVAAGVDRLSALDMNANIGVVGSCTAATPTTYFKDGIHWTTAGQTEAYGVIGPDVVAVL